MLFSHAPCIPVETHRLVVTLLRERIAELGGERDYYRHLVIDQIRDRAIPPETVLSAPVSTQPVPVESQEFGTGWSEMEWQAYHDWCQLQERLMGAVDIDFLEKMYRESFPDVSPLEVMSAA